MRGGGLGADGKLSALLDQTGQLILLSVLWLLCCVLILPAGGATVALYYAVTKSIRFGQGDAIKEFWRSLKENLLRGLAGLAVLAVAAALLYWNVNILTKVEGNSLFKAATLILAVLALFLGIYLFPILSRFRLSLGKALALAFSMSLRFLPYTFAILAGAAVVAALQIYIFPMATVLILPAVCCYGVSFPIEKALRLYMPAKEDSDDSWYYQ